MAGYVGFHTSLIESRVRLPPPSELHHRGVHPYKHTYFLVQRSKIKQLAVLPLFCEGGTVPCGYGIEVCSLYFLSIRGNKKQLWMDFNKQVVGCV